VFVIWLSAQLDLGLQLLHQSHVVSLLADIDLLILSALLPDGSSPLGPKVPLGGGNVDIVLRQGKPPLIIFKLIRLPFQHL
jgi:hypothetical protein